MKAAALYVRVSTLDQNTENQAIELRRYIESRGWTAVEYRDHGVSGAKERRPALDQLVADAKRRKFDVPSVDTSKPAIDRHLKTGHHRA